MRRRSTAGAGTTRVTMMRLWTRRRRTRLGCCAGSVRGRHRGERRIVPARELLARARRSSAKKAAPETVATASAVFARRPRPAVSRPHALPRTDSCSPSWSSASKRSSSSPPRPESRWCASSRARTPAARGRGGRLDGSRTRGTGADAAATAPARSGRRRRRAARLGGSRLTRWIVRRITFVRTSTGGRLTGAAAGSGVASGDESGRRRRAAERRDGRGGGGLEAIRRSHCESFRRSRVRCPSWRRPVTPGRSDRQRIGKGRRSTVIRSGHRSQAANPVRRGRAGDHGPVLESARAGGVRAGHRPQRTRGPGARGAARAGPRPARPEPAGHGRARRLPRAAPALRTRRS